jgi:glycosyltransferase involved in cell wall biosynthesis
MAIAALHPRSSPPSQARSDSLNVVIVDEELPYPLVSGKRIRTMGLLKRLASRHRLTYVCHNNIDAAETLRAVDYFEQLGIRTVVVERATPPRSGVGFYARLARNLLSPLPYSVTNHVSRPLIQALQQIAVTEHVDLWHCEWTPLAQALHGIPGRRLVMAHNVESVIWQRYHETETNTFKRWYIGKQWHKFRRFEREIVQHADLTLAVSDLDRLRFEEDMGATRVDVVDNGVDTEYFHPFDTPRDPATLLFLGSLEWRPNIDGVNQLLDHVYPALGRKVPHARLVIVGRNPSEEMRRRCTDVAGVELHANVADVRPYLASASCLVVPLRIGGGSRLKILESLASGTPVISTRIGAEGLHLDAGEHFTQVETIDEMADAIITDMGDPKRMFQQASAGRQQVLRLYDWNVLANRLEQLWYRCAQGGTRT